MNVCACMFIYLCVHVCYGLTEEKFYELYTAEEKAKLYNAIGYEENEMALVYPKEVILHFKIWEILTFALYIPSITLVGDKMQ